MKIARVSMLGSELSLIPLIVRQNAVLFDDIIVTFHNSIDGSREILESEPSTRIRTTSSQGYPQSTLTSQMLRDAFQAGADVCFPIDADEFLPFNERFQLEDFLKPYIEKFDYLEIRWRNCAPTSFPISSNLDNLKYAHPYASVRKVIVFRSAFEKDENLELSQGNHLVKSKVELKGVLVDGAYLLHIPFRGQLHYARKMLQGAAVMFEEEKHDLSDQWIDGAQRPYISEREVSEIAFDYGQFGCHGHTELYDQERIFGDATIFQASDELISYNLVMEKYWNTISKMLASVPSTSYSALQLKQLERRVTKFNVLNSVFAKIKIFLLRIRRKKYAE